jgi:hypothetical protein
MSALANLTRSPLRRRSLTAAVAAGVVLLVAPLSAAVVVNPWQNTPTVATEVAPADDAGLNVLYPRDKASVPTPPVQAPEAANTERAVGEWNPTGGGGGGGGSPKG